MSTRQSDFDVEAALHDRPDPRAAADRAEDRERGAGGDAARPADDDDRDRRPHVARHQRRSARRSRSRSRRGSPRAGRPSSGWARASARPRSTASTIRPNAVSRPMPGGAHLERPRLVDRARRRPSCPATFSTGSDSPVIAAWSTNEWPPTTSPSTAIRSPGLTSTTSPSRSSESSTSRSSPSRRTRTERGRRSTRFLIARRPRPTVRSSIASATSTKKHDHERGEELADRQRRERARSSSTAPSSSAARAGSRRPRGRSGSPPRARRGARRRLPRSGRTTTSRRRAATSAIRRRSLPSTLGSCPSGGSGTAAAAFAGSITSP